MSVAELQAVVEPLAVGTPVLREGPTASVCFVLHRTEAA